MVPLSERVRAWQVLPLLGSPLKSNLLPAVATCPLCCGASHLTVYADPSDGGDWLTCRHCGFSGDIIALAAGAWKLGIPATLRKLAGQNGIPTDVGSSLVADAYLERSKLRHRQIQFWQDSQTTQLRQETVPLRLLQRRFDVHQFDADWADRGGRLLAASTKSEVEAALPAGRFTGPRWQDVLVVPFYDLPGRLCGCACVGREADVDKDWVYRGAQPQSTEGGLAMLRAISGPDFPKLGKSKFVFLDPDPAIRLHVRHFRESSQTLPLAIAWDDGKFLTKQVWDWYRADDVIFWGTDQRKAIRQARMANGKVSLLEASHQELSENMRHRSPLEWLRQIRNQAVPWAAALRTRLEPKFDIEIEEDLLLLGLQGAALSEFRLGCSPSLQGKLDNISSHRSFASRVLFDGEYIIEKPDGWFRERNGERICNAVVRIDQVLVARTKASLYRGRIVFRGREYDFTAPTRDLDRNLLEWLQGYLRDTALAGVPEFAPRWGKKSLQLSLAFCEPETVKCVEFRGWDQERRQFHFPSFSLAVGGEVVRGGAVGDTSGLTFPLETAPPSGLPRQYLGLLSELNDEVRIAWAVTACVAANLLAPAVNRNRYPILLDGTAASLGAAIAGRLGCLTLKSPGQDPAASLLSVDPNWPVILGEDWLPGPWLQHAASRNTILTFPWAATRSLLLRQQFLGVSHQAVVGSLELADAAPHILPNYLQDLFRRSLQLPDDAGELVLLVLSDIKDWFGREGGVTQAVDSAKSLIWTPDLPTVAAFRDLLLGLFEQGRLTLAREDFQTDPSAAIVHRKLPEPAVWVSKDRFSDAVKVAGATQPDLPQITRALAQADALLREADNSEPGWLLRESWWDEQLSEWKA